MSDTSEQSPPAKYLRTLALSGRLAPLLGDVPAWLPLGWIYKESGGNVFSRGVEQPLYERGFGQLTLEDSQRLGFDHELVGSDEQTSLEATMALINDYAMRVRKLGIVEEPLVWWATKFRHGAGPGAHDQIARNFIRDIGRPPETIDEFKDFASLHPYMGKSLEYTLHWMENADGVRSNGLALAAFANLVSPGIAGAGLALLAGVAGLIWWAAGKR